MSAISLVLFNKNRLQKLILPQKIEGSFWLVDELNNNANIINIEAIDNNWVMKNNDDTKIIFNNAYIDHTILKPNYFYFLEYNNTKMFLYIE